MARPKQFEPETALEAAKAIFWKQGYEATSTDDLRLAMGIGRQSFYDTFGGKRQLFIEVLKRYCADGVRASIATLRGASSPLAALEALLLSYSKDSAEQRALGCLGISTIAELGQRDAEIAAIGASNGAHLESVLEELVREAKVAREVRAAVNERAAARQLSALIMGMKVMAKGGASPAALRDVANSAVDGLRRTSK